METTEVQVVDSPANMNIERMMEIALEKGQGVETIERLMAVRRELKEEWAREEYFVALSHFQATCPEIPKGKVVKDKYGKERYKYAPIDLIVKAVASALEHNGFSSTMKSEQTDTSYTAICIAQHKNGHSETTTFTVPIDADAYMSDQQKVASARTYANRYAYCNAFGIMTSDEDDDGNSSTNTRPTIKAVQTERTIDGMAKGRAEITKLIERYTPIVAREIIDTANLDMAAAKTVEDLRAVYQSLKDQCETVEREEQKETTKKSFDEASKRYAKDYDEKNSSSTSTDSDTNPKQQEIF